MYYHYFMATVFENVDEITKMEPMIPYQMYKKSKDSDILRTLENKDSTFRTIVNSKQFSITCLWPMSDRGQILKRNHIISDTLINQDSIFKVTAIICEISDKKFQEKSANHVMLDIKQEVNLFSQNTFKPLFSHPRKLSGSKNDDRTKFAVFLHTVNQNNPPFLWHPEVPFSSINL